MQYAKTDPLDAKMLAQLGAKLSPARWTAPSAIYHELQQRLARRGGEQPALQSHPGYLCGRLKAAGKASKVALCAVARKLLHLAWPIVTKQQTCDPEYGHVKSVQLAT